MNNVTENTMINHELYKQIVENTFDSTILHSDYKVIYVNETAAKLLGAKKEDLIGASPLDIFPEDAKLRIKERVRKALEEDIIGELIEQSIVTADGSTVEIELYCQPFQYGDKKAILSVLRNISSRKEMEKKLKKEINEISTPIVPISDGISIIPLVGNIDYDKANQLIEALPTKLKEQDDIKHIIIDFSGVYNLDEVIIEFLFKMNAIMKMLGICPILTGIRPEMAQKAVESGKTFANISTMSTVKQALGYLKGTITR